MNIDTVFLRTALFSLGGTNPHVPPGTLVIRGEDCTVDKGMLTIRVTEYLGDRGNVLDGKPTKLSIPVSKVDHILLADA